MNDRIQRILPSLMLVVFGLSMMLAAAAEAEVVVRDTFDRGETASPVNLIGSAPTQPQQDDDVWSADSAPPSGWRTDGSQLLVGAD